MNDAELMHDLFEGSDLAHGRSEMTKQVNTKGKHEARSWVEKRPATLEDWEKHLKGEAGLGIPPLNSKALVRWGAIDVDVYRGLSIETLNNTIQRAGLPLVICRSKSGGPHIYLFLKEWVPARDMMEKLDSFAGFLGFGTSEIFPKQAAISTDESKPDYGSWINMPYFAGTSFLRYALDAENKALKTIPDFHAYCTTRRLSAADFAKLEAPTPADIFPDGPPCLNQIFAARPTDNRNILLCNAAVYAKKAFPETWKAKVDEYNRLFPEPLGSNEVETIKKSYDRKEYRYQCPKPPLCNFCDSSKCRKMKHGVGGGEYLPQTRSLTMIASSPPIWYLDVNVPGNAEPVRMSLSTEELQNPRLFQKRCMEVIQKMPPTMKQEQWEPIVAGLMAHCNRVDLPPELTPAGQFTELLYEYLANRASDGGSREDIVRGVPFRDKDGYYFRFKDLAAHLFNQRFNLLKPNEVQAVLRDLGAKALNTKLGGISVRYIHLPNQSDDNNGNQPKLPVPGFQAPY